MAVWLLYWDISPRETLSLQTDKFFRAASKDPLATVLKTRAAIVTDLKSPFLVTVPLV